MKPSRARRLGAAAAVGAAFILGAVAVVAVARGENAARVQAITSTAIGVVGLLFVIVPRLWSQRHSGQPVDADPSRLLDDAAGRLAQIVRQRWRKEARDRHITSPATILVSWTRTPTKVASPAAERHRSLLGARPTSGRSAKPRLLTSGVLRELHDLYRHPDVRKTVIIGDPGAGKTGALILLLLDALTFWHEACDAATQKVVPVPVLLTLGDWDPTTTPLGAWAAAVLERDYGLVTTSSGRSLYRALLDEGRIALLLDGLDEMPQRFWGDAVNAIQAEVDLRVVLTARPVAANYAYLNYHARVHLEPVDVSAAVQYLTTVCRPDRHQSLWAELGDGMLVSPACVAAQTLTTPLMLTLALNTYDRPNTDPRELLSTRHFPSSEAMEEQLLDQIIPVAFSTDFRPEWKQPIAELAAVYLTELAASMGESRDLKWWGASASACHGCLRPSSHSWLAA